MSLDANKNTLEQRKFVETVDGETAVRILNVSEWVNSAVGNKIEVTYPSATQEVYTYKNGATTYKVITIDYTDGTKIYFSLIERTS